MQSWQSLVFALTLAFTLQPLAASAEPDMTAPVALEAARSGKVRLIDIRTPQEWRQTGVAPGAGRVDMYRGAEPLLRGVLQEVKGDRNAPIALICRTGNRTTQAQKFLQQQGFTQVFNVKEGMAGSAAGPGWLRRGLPVESCAAC
jgi:rhodanese-related sulfurtransferase